MLILHINIVGDVTFSDNYTRRLVFFQFISLSHYTVPLLQRQHHNTKKKRKLNKNAANSFDSAAANEQLTVNITSNFPQYCNFMPAILIVRHFHVRHFQRSRIISLRGLNRP